MIFKIPVGRLLSHKNEAVATCIIGDIGINNVFTQRILRIDKSFIQSLTPVNIMARQLLIFLFDRLTGRQRRQNDEYSTERLSHTYLFTKIAFGNMASKPLLPSTIFVISTSTATQQSIQSSAY